MIKDIKDIGKLILAMTVFYTMLPVVIVAAVVQNKAALRSLRKQTETNKVKK